MYGNAFMYGNIDEGQYLCTFMYGNIDEGQYKL